MTMTARLPAPLQAEAAAYAAGLGISLNALLAVALRDYLDVRRTMLKSGGQSAVPLAVVPVEVEAVPAAPVVFKAPKSPRAPCPCGSRQQWRHCHGKAG